MLLAAAILTVCTDNKNADPSFPIPQSAPCPPNIVVSVRNNAVRLCGGISTASVRLAISELEKEQTKSLVIDSFGGETIAAIELGRYLSDNEVSLYVNGICLSACSQFIMVAAPKLYLRQNSIVGFHDSQYATNLIVGEENIRSGMIEEANQEKAFYEDLGVNLSLLTLPMEQLNIDCVVDLDAYKVSGALAVQMSYDFYMPNENYFREVFPGQLNTDWPDLEAARQKIDGINIPNMRFKLGTPIRSPLDQTALCTN